MPTILENAQPDVAIIVKDTTDIQRLTKLLRESQELLTTVMDYMPHPICITDFESNKVLHLNKFAQSNIKCAVGMKCAQLISEERGGVHECDEEYACIWYGGRPQTEDMIDGIIRWTDDTLARLRMVLHHSE